MLRPLRLVCVITFTPWLRCFSVVPSAAFNWLINGRVERRHNLSAIPSQGSWFDAADHPTKLIHVLGSSAHVKTPDRCIAFIYC
jgi:hypothetical protein